MRALNQGKILAPGDLGINVRDSSGCLVDPVSITYTIFSVDALGVRTLASAPKLVPVRGQTPGVYWAGGAVPTVWLGDYQLVWYLQQYVGNEEKQVYEDFEVVRIDPATTSFEAPSVLLENRPGLNKTLVARIMTVRELLGDEDPDRNYHFSPPTAGKVVAGFNDRVGFIWTDRTIIRMLRFAMEQANTANPMAMYSYTVETAPKAWGEAICIGAAAKCLSKQAAVWISNEFEYSLNGVSLSLNKSASYMSLATEYASEFTEWLPNLTANRPCSVGLIQSRWMLG